MREWIRAHGWLSECNGPECDVPFGTIGNGVHALDLNALSVLMSTLQRVCSFDRLNYFVVGSPSNVLVAMCVR